MTHLAQPDHAFAFATSDSLQWEGHMYDGLATTYGPNTGAIMRANADALWVNGNRGSFFLPRPDIVTLCRGRLYPWFFQGVRLVHTRADLPETIVFLSRTENTRKVLDHLHALGYPIHCRPHRKASESPTV